MNNPIIFVSLGPGDPELITLKGLRALQEAEVILTPATRSSNNTVASRSKDIITSLEIDHSKIELFYVPMSRMRQATIDAYQQVAAKANGLANKGLKVVITAEGDAAFYSSAQYIEEMLWEMGAQTSRVAGVPAFIDCARLASTHIVNQDTSFEVIARVESPEVLTHAMNQDKSIVLMKISQWEESIKAVIAQSHSHTFHYVESCGVDGKEFYTCDKEVILDRKFPYFAIILIKQEA
ncbi:MAG: precorrin-2 C(20)-methyltransferase [Rikenellaceae bacterium]